MKRLKIAIQKSGRLNEGSLKLLKECGISIENGRNQLKASSSNFPAEVLFLRNSDIPQYVEDGVADIAIIGENVIEESPCDLEKMVKLGFSKCRLSLAVPKEVDYFGLEFFNHKKIATSYPNTLMSFLDENGIRADIHKINGSVEIAPNIGLAEDICDLVSSGSTLFSNGLKEVEVILKSEACLVKGKALSTETEEILEKMLFRIQSVLKARHSRYILMNVPNDKIEEVSSILPVLKSPTIMPLAEEGWSSLHSVINENQFWEVIDQLKSLGAQGILVIPIEKIVL
jgi:ATP phosphoribosyltransferase